MSLLDVSNKTNNRNGTFMPTCQAFHPIDGNDSMTLLSLKVPFSTENDPQVATEQKQAYFKICLDISGSMAGSGIRCAKMAMKMLIDHLIKTCGVPADMIFVYLYGSDCTVRRLGQPDDRNWIEGIKAGGGTIFANVFNEIVSTTNGLFEKIKDKDADIDITLFFLTDGQDGYPKKLTKAKENLGQLLKSPRIESTVHTFGFTESHDASLLSWLTSLGSNSGCFQYIKEANAIETSVSTTVDLIGDSVMSMKRKIAVFTGQEIATAKASDWTVVTMDSDRISGSVVLREKPFTKEFVYWREHSNLQEDSNTAIDETKKLVVQWLEGSDFQRIIRMTTFIQHELLRLVEAINAIGSSNAHVSQKRVEFLKIDAETEDYNKALGVMTSTSARNKSKAEREACMNACQRTRSLLQSFLAVKADAHKQGGTISNTSLATFNSLAYGQVNEAKLKAKLDSRAGKNTNLFSDLDEKVAAIVAGIDLDTMEAAESQNTLKELTCAISTNSYIDALRDGDCLCMTLDVSRGAGAIADPSQLVIKSIFPSFLTSSMFTSALEHSLSVDIPENVHGGFNRNTDASIVPGVAQESITAVLPLYINENHWKVARLRLKPILGYVVTLDATGYTYSQSTTVPFLVLVKALESYPMTEFRQHQIKLILGVCDAIYRDSRDLRENTKTLVTQFCSSHLHRTVDVITNLYVFLGQVICALRAGDISIEEMTSLLPQFEVAAIEEQIRRDMSWKVSESLVGNILNWLNVKKMRDVVNPGRAYQEQHDAYVRALENSGERGNDMEDAYRSVFQEAQVLQGFKASSNVTKPTHVTITAAGSRTATVTEPVFKVPDFDPVSWELSVASLDRLGNIQNAVSAGVDKIRRLMAIIQSPLDDDLSQVLASRLGSMPESEFAHEFYARYSPKVVLATLLQAYAHTRNSDRRAVENLMTPFERVASSGPDSSSDEALQYMKSLYEAKMSQIINKIVADVQQSYQESKNDASASTFASTCDLKVAAGVLAESRFRGGEGGRIVTSCAALKMRLPREKIQMMLSGKYKGVRLFEDTAENGDDILRWYPCKKSLYRMFKNYHDRFSFSEWCKFHPDRYDNYIATRYVFDGYLSELNADDQALAQALSEKRK
ncbi:hypothetical protein BGZ76_009693 [Entomortierella beljakovae]|nr:hypothetical protein BGZ76_009693 [Entomortierella beljakovae]